MPVVFTKNIRESMTVVDLYCVCLSDISSVITMVIVNILHNTHYKHDVNIKKLTALSYCIRTLTWNYGINNMGQCIAK